MYRRTHSPYSLAGNFPAVETDSLFGLETFSTGGRPFFCVCATDRLPPGYGVELRFSGQTHRQHG
jgi:hypothetical protein